MSAMQGEGDKPKFDAARQLDVPVNEQIITSPPTELVDELLEHGSAATYINGYTRYSVHLLPEQKRALRDIVARALEARSSAGVAVEIDKLRGEKVIPPPDPMEDGLRDWLLRHIDKDLQVLTEREVSFRPMRDVRPGNLGAAASGDEPPNGKKSEPSLAPSKTAAGHPAESVAQPAELSPPAAPSQIGGGEPSAKAVTDDADKLRQRLAQLAAAAGQTAANVTPTPAASEAPSRPAAQDRLLDPLLRGAGRKLVKGVEVLGGAGLAAAEAVVRGAEKVQRARGTLGEKAEHLKTAYRAKLEDRARPRGDTIMGEQPVRSTALTEAEKSPDANWTLEDTDKYIVALGAEVLANDASIMRPFLKKRQILEIPKDLKAIYKRGNQIIRNYIDKQKAGTRLDKIQAYLAPEEQTRLRKLMSDRTFNEEQRALYLKIRARKKPYPLPTPSEWRVFSKVWGISDILRKSNREAMKKGANQGIRRNTKVLEIPKHQIFEIEEGKKMLTPAGWLALNAKRRAQDMSSDEQIYLYILGRKKNRGKPIGLTEKGAFERIQTRIRPELEVEKRRIADAKK